MSQAIVRWGLLSTARINRRLIPAIRASERGQLVAVASRSLGAARAYAREWDIPLAYGSYEEMLDADTVDAVYISLPNHLHASWTIAALEAGKHVLCEKPLALSLEEVDAMFAAARRHRRVLSEAFMYRHHPQMKRVGDWVAAGHLGRVTLIRAIFHFAMANRENIRLQPHMGGGCLWDVGVYPLSFAQYIMASPPIAVYGREWVGPTGVDEQFSGMLMYEDGAMAQIASAFNSPFYTGAEVIGQRGRVEILQPFVFHPDKGPYQVISYDEEGRAQAWDIPQSDLYGAEVEDMHRSILEGAPPYLRPEESRNHVRAVLALYQSAKSGNLVYMGD